MTINYVHQVTLKKKERKKENKQAVHIPIHQEVLSLPIQGHAIGEFLLSATLAVLPSSAHSLQSQEKKVEITRVGSTLYSTPVLR